MEKVIKAACGSPGNIFYSQGGVSKSGFSFSLKKHSKAAQKKA
jgi:hypothetical protein